MHLQRSPVPQNDTIIPIFRDGEWNRRARKVNTVKASANLKEHKAWFFRALVSIALCVVTKFPFDCVCSSESFTPVSGRSEQHVISAHHWGAWPDQRHTWKLPSEAAQAGTSLKNWLLSLLTENIPSAISGGLLLLAGGPSYRVLRGSTKNKQCFSMNSSLLKRSLDYCRGTWSSTGKIWVWKSKLWETSGATWEAALRWSSRCLDSHAVHQQSESSDFPQSVD